MFFGWKPYLLTVSISDDSVSFSVGELKSRENYQKFLSFTVSWLFLRNYTLKWAEIWRIIVTYGNQLRSVPLSSCYCQKMLQFITLSSFVVLNVRLNKHSKFQRKLSTLFRSDWIGFNGSNLYEEFKSKLITENLGFRIIWLWNSSHTEITTKIVWISKFKAKTS